MKNENRFYVYVYFRLDGTPVYVGIGCGDRWLKHQYNSSNSRLKRLVNKFGPLPVVKIRENITRAQAEETEKVLIDIIGRANLNEGPLFNFTDGGEGCPGYIPSIETRKKSSECNKGQIPSPLAIANSVKARKGKKQNRTPEWNARISAARKGKPHPHAGVPRTSETRAKISETKKLVRASLQTVLI